MNELNDEISSCASFQDEHLVQRDGKHGQIYGAGLFKESTFKRSTLSSRASELERQETTYENAHERSRYQHMDAVESKLRRNRCGRVCISVLEKQPLGKINVPLFQYENGSNVFSTWRSSCIGFLILLGFMAYAVSELATFGDIRNRVEQDMKFISNEDMAPNYS